MTMEVPIELCTNISYYKNSIPAHSKLTPLFGFAESNINKKQLLPPKQNEQKSKIIISYCPKAI
jgi:hypothetical protein